MTGTLGLVRFQFINDKNKIVVNFVEVFRCLFSFNVVLLNVDVSSVLLLVYYDAFMSL